MLLIGVLLLSVALFTAHCVGLNVACWTTEQECARSRARAHRGAVVGLAVLMASIGGQAAVASIAPDPCSDNCNDCPADEVGGKCLSTCHACICAIPLARPLNATSELTLPDHTAACDIQGAQIHGFEVNHHLASPIRNIFRPPIA